LLHVRHSESALFKRYDVVMACDEVRGECGHVRHGSFDGLSAATTMEHYSGLQTSWFQLGVSGERFREFEPGAHSWCRDCEEE